MYDVQVGELREWLAGAASGASRMLVVYGPPGSGKSTAVYVCAAEAGLAVRSWTDHGSRGTLANSRGAVMEHGCVPLFQGCYVSSALCPLCPTSFCLWSRYCF